MLHSICQQIWKTQQWPQDRKRSVFIPIPKKGNVKECSNYCTAAAKSLQSCLTLCDPIDGSLPVSPIPGILQAWTLEWVAISFSNEWKWKVKVKSLSRVRLFMTPWTAAHQAPLSMGLSRQEYWSGVPLPSPNYCTIALIAYAIKVILKILQARHQQYVNSELPDVQAGFRKGRETRDQIANIHWIIEKAMRVPENHLLLFYWLCQSLWLCGS